MRHLPAFVAVAALALAADRDVRFSGSVSGAETFQREIRAGLVFALRPDGDGWRIAVTSLRGCPDSDFASVITTPYRFRNGLMINTDYLVMAKDAVRQRHEFEFVLDCRHYREEEERRDKVLYPSNYTDAQVDEATAKIGSSPKGKGGVTILTSKIVPSDNRPEGKDLGRIESMTFEVHLVLPE
jgi:hypothetical protein